MSRALCIGLAAISAVSVATAEPLPDADPAVDRGFAVRVPPAATAEEVLGQPGFWALEVDLKPLRIAKVTRPDGSTDTVYYLVYRVARRDLIAPTEAASDAPENNYDDPPGPERLVPQFTLVSAEDDRPAAYPDVVDPLAYDVIRRREMRGPVADVTLHDSVTIARPLPPEVGNDRRPTDDEYLYGVAIWPEVDPDIDRFAILFEGFSNGYVMTEAGETARRIFRQAFWRPGDRFARQEREFRFDGEPAWQYAPDDAI